MAIPIVLISLLLLVFLYILSTITRRNHPGLKALANHAYAHRGLHGDGVPENSLEAFRLAKENGYGVELDVQLLKDGNLAIFHDADLERMTGKPGKILDLAADQLQEYALENTGQTIPLFSDILNLFAGQVPVIVEIKSCKDYPQLCDKVCKMLDGYEGLYCLESFDPRCVRWLKKNRPELIRGQLSENYLKATKAKIPWILKFLLTFQMLNFLTKPDFVAYKCSDRKHLSNVITRGIWKTQGVTWTVASQAEFDDVKKENWIPIFEGFRP